MLLSEIPRVAQESPLVVLFCWERYNLFKMVLPRIVNATRRVGGYLWVIDDASRDERIKMILDQYLSDGYVDHVTYGSKSRFIDWTPPPDMAFGGPCARRSVVMNFLTHRKVPMVIFCDPDIVVAPDALENMLAGARIAREANLPASCYSGFRYNKTIFNVPEQSIAGFSYRLHSEFVSMALSLVTFDTVRQVEKDMPNKFLGRWSLNEYAVWAYSSGLQACYLMNVAAQHVGIGMVGRTWTAEPDMNVFAFNEDGSHLEVAGFDTERFLSKVNGTHTFFQDFCYNDHVKIEDKRPVHPEFLKLKEIVGEN